MKIRALHSLILLASFTVWAQEAAPSLPSEPLLNRAPEYSQWVITFGSPKTAARKGRSAAKSKVQKTVQVTKTGPLRHILTMESDGRHSEIWCQGATQTLVRPEWKTPFVFDATGRENALKFDFSKTDFPGCEWVSARNYKGIQKVEGRDCLVFADKMAALPDTPPADTAAYIDLETRLPLILIAGGETLTFRFGPPPQSMLSLPANVQAAIDAKNRELQSLSRRAGTPF